jgi:hypothetical protein
VTVANAVIRVSGLRENPSATADASGNFEMTLSLLPGSNEIHLRARDPVTLRDSEEFVRRVNVVTDVEESASPAAIGLTLAEPESEATITGAVAVAGTAAPNQALEVSAALVTAPTPTFTVTDAGGSAVKLEPAAPSPPDPLALTADASGAFAGNISLAPGTWDLLVTPTDAEPVARRLTVIPGAGLAGTLALVEGDSYLEVEQDGTPIDGVSGGISDDGERIELAADDEIRIRAGNAGAVGLTINGIGLGAMGGDGAVVEWRISRTSD